MQPSGHSPDLNLLDQDLQGIKRKLDVSEEESKRARQKTGKFAIFSESLLIHVSGQSPQTITL